MIHSPTQGQFDTAHLRAIHKRIFQDVYEWAGLFRTVNISKDGHLFGAAGFIEGALRDVFQKLFRESYLRELDRESSQTVRDFFWVKLMQPTRSGKETAALKGNSFEN